MLRGNAQAPLMTTAWLSLASCEAAMLSPISWSVKKPERLSPSGSSTSSCSAVSYGLPVSVSITRPATTTAALL